MPRVDQETSRLHRDYVRLIVERTRKPPTRIAKDIEISPSTLTRLLNEPDGSTATLHARTLRKLQEYSGIALPVDAGEDMVLAARGFREDAVPYDARQADPAFSTALRALIDGRKAADPWTIKTRSLERIGFMPGDVVIVDLGARPESGDAVCAQVYDWRRGTAETVMRLYEPPYLVAASLDESLRRPLVVDDDQVIIKGVVLPHRLRPGTPTG